MIVLLLVTVGLRLFRLDQPLVENYVGRQIPTAMVARNLDRAGGFLRPQLDTGPFPNLFLVEPPVFAAVAVFVKRLTTLSLDASGRLLSAIGIVLGAWGLFGIVRRRDGDGEALVAVAVFSLLPITIRYGRAFQGDALMLGCLLASVRCWDEAAASETRSWRWLLPAWILLATGLSLKIIAVWVLLPILLLLNSRRHDFFVPRISWGFQCLLVLSAIVPAVGWYMHSAQLLGAGAGSSASMDNARIWLAALSPSSLLQPARLLLYARYVLVRAFTPLALPLCLLVGWSFLQGERDRLWRWWTLAAIVGLVAVSGKIHHEYYWLVLAPPATVLISRGLSLIASLLPAYGVLRVAPFLGFAALALVQVSDTFRPPEEWSHLDAAARAVQTAVPEEALLVAPEALLYQARHRGARLEFHPQSAHRAGGEWGESLLAEADPVMGLVELYRERGIRFLADLPPASADASRRALHRSLALRYTIMMDGPDLFLVDLKRPSRDEAAANVAQQP